MKIVYDKNEDKVTFDKTYKFFFKNSLLNSYFHNVYSDINDVVLLEEVIDTFNHRTCEILMSNLINLLLYYIYLNIFPVLHNNLHFQNHFHLNCLLRLLKILVLILIQKHNI